MDFWDYFTISCWVFTTAMVIYNIRNMRPIPRHRREKTDLRGKALRRLQESGKSDFEKSMDAMVLSDKENVEYLRLFAKFIDEYSAPALISFVESLRLARMKFYTNLKSDKVTSEQMKVYSDLSKAVTDSMPPQWIKGDQKEVQKSRLTFMRTAFYAMDHMDEADRIMEIVTKRGVYDLKQVKGLMNEIDSAPNGPLNDGML